MRRPVLTALTLFASAYAVMIGPVTDLYVVNGNVTPDGYTRK